MFPELLTYAPTIAAEFHLSLPQDLLTSLRLLQAVNAFEGLSEWVYQTAATLPDEFCARLDLLGYPIKWCFRRQDSLIWRLPPNHPVHTSWEAFGDYLESMRPEEYQRVLLLNLSHEAHEQQLSPAPGEAELRRMLMLVREREQERWGRVFVDLMDDEPLIKLAQEPHNLKRGLVDLFTDFWEQYYRRDFEINQEALVRSIAYYRQHSYPGSFTDLFRQVTGRALAPATRDYIHEHLEKIERVIFSPCAHLGLYFQLTLCHPILVVAFNYRMTPTQPREGTATLELFPPLKALADESRLHILSLLQAREMYAQEIVEAMGLSQSTVSRHLQLLERTEVVTTRQMRGMKFYSIDRAQGQKIIEALGRLIG